MTVASDRPRAESGSLARSTASALVLQMGGAALNLFTQSVLARFLGAVLFGQYSFAFNLAQLLAGPADLGASTSVTRFVPEYRVQRQDAQLRGLLLVTQLVPLALGSVVAGATAAVVSLVGAGSAPLAVMFVAVGSMPLFVLSIVQMNVLRALGLMYAAIGPQLVLQPALLLAAVLAWPDASMLTYAWLTLGALAVTVVVQVVILRRSARRLRATPATYRLRHWLTVSLPMLATNVLQLAFQRLDIVAVGVFLDARSAGVYVVANRLAVATASLQKAVVTVVAPQMSGLHWSGRSAEVERLVLRGLKLVFGPALVVTLALVAVGHPILGLIGHQYQAGYLAMVVYALGQLVGVSAGPVGWLAQIIDEERAMARVALVSASIAVVGYVALIPTIGIVGAAAANSLGIAYRNVAANLLVRRHGFHISVVRAFRKGRDR